jgi:YD repeat-containing protein
VFTYTYDAAGRITRIAAGTEVTEIAYERGSDNRSLVSVGGLSSAFAYDAAGRLQARTDSLDGQTFASRFAYDANDNLEEITYPSGRKVRYEFDSENQISEISRPSTTQVYANAFAYHPSGAMSGYTAMNGVATTVTFDAARHWLKTIQAGALNLTYLYDDAGNVEEITDTRPGMSQFFEYDELDRLTSAQGVYPTQTFEYDAHGNRTGTGYTYESGNPFKLTSFGSVTLGYDANGNVTSASAGSATYTFGPRNLMSSATTSGVTTAFAYDADDWRVKKVSGSTTTYSLRGPSGQLLTEWSITGSTTTMRDHVYAGSRLVTVAVAETTAP